jgi:sortase A
LILIIVGILIALYPLYTNLKAYYQQTILEKELNSQISAIEPTSADQSSTESPVIEDTTTAAETKPQTVQPKKINAMMRIEIPNIHLSSIVVVGTSKYMLSYGPGWYEESAYPGEGNTAIAAHKDMYGSWFRNLYKLNPGNQIYLTYKGKKYIYFVEKVYPITTNDWSVIAPTEEPVLTLTTCYTKTERLACRAVLKEIQEI